jgi:hypothetical protein
MNESRSALRPATVTRDAIVEALRGAFEPLEWAHAAWLGGSDATGRTDAWSDVDFVVLVDDERVEEAFRIAAQTLKQLSGLAHRYRIPSPTWHGHEQEFFQVEGADPCHFVDFVPMARSSRDRLLEPERHGEQHVLFDPAGLIRPAPFDRAAHLAKMEERLATLRERFPLFQGLVTKAVRRGAVPDAVATYYQMTLRPLVEILRMRHAPERFDFGLRYLDRDLPPDLRCEIERISLAGTLCEVESHRCRAQALFEETLAALDAGEWGIDRV